MSIPFVQQTHEFNVQKVDVDKEAILQLGEKVADRVRSDVSRSMAGEAKRLAYNIACIVPPALSAQ